ncbi:MAG: hypothetical protein OQK94_04700 [Gammaproteobacteria bacterium]|nr:hypothetical protein [Gammaproteobacteria bacterium]MCW8839777.1 hypothetical protein [Gammaproteobacteria bacterium]MCW8959063.1 hypothetical protein [Gammaproteobacteria bacterium]MCW8972081.1 hypothetical protein [Gammaproteobacteria bacterium]MCW8993594.1 hypothetical protein [Gammaproteobacteria bacterium]
MPQHTGMGATSCEECRNAAHNCAGSSCSCYQCGNCSVVLLPESPPVTGEHFTELFASQATSQLNDHPFLLFRPPRG